MSSKENVNKNIVAEVKLELDKNGGVSVLGSADSLESMILMTTAYIIDIYEKIPISNEQLQAYAGGASPYFMQEIRDRILEDMLDAIVSLVKANVHKDIEGESND